MNAPASEPERPNPPQKPGHSSPPSSDTFLHLLLLSEGALAIVGWAAGAWVGIDWPSMVQLNRTALLIGLSGGIGLFGLHVLLLTPGGTRNPLYRLILQPLQAALSSWVSRLHIPAILLLAAASGVAEEIFFRGWLQTQFGLVAASILFGLCHIWSKDALPYGLYAMGMGFVLGLLFEQTECNLWAPALAHAINNLLGFLALKYRWFPGSRL